ncbi:TraR/DksA C4-type zinc finger protein [Moritella viscosa]|uniref:Probable rRNA transcription initiatior protein,putative phage protein n=1 Tax=Moritella viscosa TaxID=80854 RepID=A0ABY1HJ05_9GAMM|nr:TraR/DksA C4-type zinc finger protein [Moritella viscosa]SGY96171.1 Probable rRNA transcription initiatior protein,putative phage gene [Moritella viscosa]SGZ02133.1 Probable rRNA transcription initiatior protein,putative phage gene [Moritella viscosa]SHO06764.1 Probable rRNA transcription initiatior protein,putative phage gene [Moritella viscosa]SHO28079.1 Probable rRNA transcription initiatior protein,putative phage gene [Moritella viscosa]
MDALDSACALEAKQTEMALTNHFAKQPKQTQLLSAKECNECGADIPKARQEAVKGCQFCIVCQDLIDKGKL